MHIGLDGAPLKEARTGIGRYTLNLLRHLVRGNADGVEDRVEVFAGPGIRRRAVQRARFAAAVESLGAGERIGIRWANVPGSLLKAVWETFECLSVERWMPGIEIYHGTNYYVPPLRSARGIVTVHDLTFRTHPQFHTWRTRTTALTLARSLRRCRRVLADSANTRQDFLRHYRFPEDRVHVVPLAAEPVFRRITDDAHLDAARRRLDLPGCFVLSLSTLEPRKNLPGLIEAFGRALPNLPDECRLVLVGLRGWKYRGIDTRVRDLGLAARIHFAGFLEDEDLASVLNLARCLVYPSFYEGFGLPILEAMASGTPVVCSDNSSLPEVAGDAAILCDARDTAALADGMVRLTTDPTARESYRRAGLERARLFSWERTARETRAVYERALGD